MSKDPQTADEFLEQGSLDEESGDRWLGSDLAKSLRFYQKAYASYLQSIRLENTLDAYYNSSRLMFLVYHQYYKTDGISVDELTNVGEVLTYDDRSVVQPLSNIVRAHERAIDVAKTLGVSVPFDLLFNVAVVYTEVIEVEQQTDTPFYKLVEVALRAQDILRDLLHSQFADFRRFLVELDSIDESAGESVPSYQSGRDEESKQEELTSEEVVQPTDIIDTVLAGYKLSQAVLESVTSSDELKLAQDLVNPFITILKEAATEIVTNYSERALSPNEMVAIVTNELVNELEVAQTYIIGLTYELTAVYALWNDANLPETSERHMLAADNIQSLLDRHDIGLPLVNASPDHRLSSGFWEALTEMTQHLKKAQDILNRTFQEKKKTPSGLDVGLGALTTQISEVMIARADIDLQRCQIVGHESAEKNRNVLLQNCKTLLKNAMTIANVPGGLRERVAEKCQREKKKVDAVLRLCVLENKTSIDELDTILGRAKWTGELPNLVQLGYFDEFGIRNISIPTSF